MFPFLFSSRFLFSFHHVSFSLFIMCPFLFLSCTLFSSHKKKSLFIIFLFSSCFLFSSRHIFFSLFIIISFLFSPCFLFSFHHVFLPPQSAPSSPKSRRRRTLFRDEDASVEYDFKCLFSSYCSKVRAYVT